MSASDKNKDNKGGRPLSDKDLEKIAGGSGTPSSSNYGSSSRSGSSSSYRGSSSSSSR